MRRKFLTKRPKNLTTLDLLIGDEILYRDENYFAELKTAARPNPSVIRVPSLSTNQEISDCESSSEIPSDDQLHHQQTTMGAPLEETGDVGPLEPCKICERTFAADRIQKHLDVCQRTTAKSRPVFDVVGNRIGGTEAGEMVAAGKIKLEPAKPSEKKSELMKKYNTESSGSGPTTAPAQGKERKPNDENKKGKNGEAYQVVFDDSEKMKMRKPTASLAGSKLPPIVMKQSNSKQGQDLRHLSAKNWKKQRNQVSPDFNSSMTTSSFSDDDNDFLASSMVSTKTVCSDAFDFLFDENNLNPEHSLHKEFNRQHSTITEVSHIAPLGQKAQGSACCVIS